MAGDATNAAIWTDADVFIAPAGTDGPADVDAPWATAWKPVGLLDGDEGFTTSRDEDSDDKYAWGGVLVRKTRAHHKVTVRFVAMEDNDTVYGLVHPGSERDTTGGVTTSTIKVPRYTDFAIGFEMRDGDKVKRRYVRRSTIEEIGDITENETDVAVYEITVVLFPEADGTLYTEIEADTAA